MKPVHTLSSNLVYTGPNENIRDLHCERLKPGIIKSVWWFTPEERKAIANGSNLSVTMFTEPIPPVAIHVTSEQGVGEDSPILLERMETL